MPTTFEAAQILFLFVVPGFIIDQVIGSSIPRMKRDATELVIAFVTLSGVNFAMAGPLLLYADLNAWPHVYAGWYSFLWFVLLFITPVLLGFSFTWVLNRDRLVSLYDALGLRSRHPIPRAWDHMFGQRKAYWVRITLQDGSMIGGRFGGKSFASSYPVDEDIYIEQIYQLDESGSFVRDPVPRSAGALIRGKDVKFVEFYN